MCCCWSSDRNPTSKVVPVASADAHLLSSWSSHCGHLAISFPHLPPCLKEMTTTRAKDGETDELEPEEQKVPGVTGVPSTNNTLGRNMHPAEGVETKLD